MPLSGGGNRWTDHVRAFANSHGVSYMCAMSNPQCSATYKGVKPAKAPKAKRLTKKEERENIKMTMEDKPAPARKEALGDIFESATPVEGTNSPAVRAVLKNKGSLNKVLSAKIADQQGMLAEDINRALPDTKGKAKGKAGRPKKYDNAEEARQAKIANTIRRAKERVVEKKDTKLGARIERAKKEWEKWAEGLEEPRGNAHSDGKGSRRENELIIERVEKIKKKYPSLKVSDWYRPLVFVKSDEKNQTIALPAELTGKGFDVGTTKTGGMMGWVKSIIGRHPQLTPQQIRDAERFADNLMADPRGITFEGASVIPLDVRKELAQEFYNRTTMGREDKDAIGTASETFADEIRKQYEAQKKKGKGRMSGGFGFNDFVSGLNKLNPVMWGIQNHPDVGIKLGEVTNNNLLPAVVAVGKPVYDATAVATATALTGNPALGKIAGDQFWNFYGKPYDPQNRQDNEALKKISERIGKEAGKQAERKLGKGRKPRGGATALQKGLSAEMRSYTKTPLQDDLNQIIHSNDAPHTKFGQTPNAYRDFTNSFDPKAQKQIDRAIAVLSKHGITTPPQMKASAPAFVPRSGKGLLGADPATWSPDLRPRLGADPRTYTPSWLPQGGGFDKENFTNWQGDQAPIFTADWRGPEVQAERQRLTDQWRSQLNGGSVLGDYSAIINHLVSHITDPKEPVDPRDYSHTIRLINGIRKLKGGMYGMGNSDVRSPTSTRTEVRSPTKTSTEAYTRGNVTITGSAGDGPMSVYIAGRPKQGGYLGDSQFDPHKYNPNDKSTWPESKKYDWNFDHRGFNPFSYNKWSQSGGADPREANTPDDYYAVEPEYPEADDDGMGGIDWGAIGQALMDDSLDQQQPHQGNKNADEP